MKALQEKIVVKRKGTPDDTRTFDKGRMDVFQFEPGVVGVITFQPGWKWSESVKPIVGTASCEAAHLNYIVSGRLAVHMDDGTEVELGPGDIARIPSGHDAWVVGTEQLIAVDFTAADKYALPKFN